jgi:hypothetical protein
VCFFEHESFFKHKDVLNTKEYKSFLEGTTTSTPNSEELTLGGESESDPNDDEVHPRRSTRSKRPLARLQDYVTCKVSYHIQNYVSYKNIFPKLG